MPTLQFTGTGAQTRVSPDKAISGGFIPPDPQEAGLAPGQILSPDPTTASGQTINVE
jgi:hypothetical protein